MAGYIYDVECYSNFFCASFIEIKTKLEVIDNYCKADWKKDIDLKQSTLKELNIKTFIICNCDNYEINQVEELCKFVKDECIILVGYNNRNYDDLMLDYLTICKFTNSQSSAYINNALYNLSSSIIGADGITRWNSEIFKNYTSPYKSSDLMAMLFEKIARKSLKQVAINLKWYRIQDLPIASHEVIKKDKIDEIIDYNINDILITHRLYWKKLEEIDTRIKIGQIYGLDLINSNRSNIADRLMVKFYADETGLKPVQFKQLRTIRRLIKFQEIINPAISFNNDKLVNFLNKLKKTVLVIGSKGKHDKEGWVNKFEEKLIFDNNVYTFATGGLHTQDRPGVLESTNDIIYRDADVTSYYPSIIAKLRISPAHLDKAVFLHIVEVEIKERVEAKHAGLKAKAEALKIVLNSGLFGKMGFEFGWLFDLKAMYEVTINGQLYLLKLIEMLSEVNIQVVSANTDGIVCKIHKHQLNDYERVCRNWCNWSKLELEFTDYIKYIRTTVNDYLALKNTGDVIATSFFTDEDLDEDRELTDEDLDKYIKKNSKTKGDFIDDIQLDKGYPTPIIAKCLHNYFLKGIAIDDTLYNSRDIYDFCLSQKTGNVFINEYHTIKDGKLSIEILQKTIRYYVSRRGGVVIKKYKDSNKRISILAKHNVTLLNDFIEYDDFSKYDIKYNYYKSRIMDIINKIYLQNTSDIKGTKSKSGISGKLFD